MLLGALRQLQFIQRRVLVAIENVVEPVSMKFALTDSLQVVDCVRQ